VFESSLITDTGMVVFYSCSPLSDNSVVTRFPSSLVVFHFVGIYTISVSVVSYSSTVLGNVPSVSSRSSSGMSSSCTSLTEVHFLSVVIFTVTIGHVS
jgi:hypothetical protein